MVLTKQRPAAACRPQSCSVRLGGASLLRLRTYGERGYAMGERHLTRTKGMWGSTLTWPAIPHLEPDSRSSVLKVQACR